MTNRPTPDGLLGSLSKLHGDFVGPDEFTDEGWLNFDVEYEDGDIVLSLSWVPLPDIEGKPFGEKWVLTRKV